jgi:hypothetical protein
MKTTPGADGRRSKAISPSWHEEDGVIFFSVISDGTTGRDWIKRLEYQGFRLGNDAKAILRSADFKPTSNVRTNVAIIKGLLFEEMKRNTENVRALALERKFSIPDPELLCLMREKFLDNDLMNMGLFWIIGMHTPIDVDGELRLLGADRIEDREGYGSFVVAYRGQPKATWNRDTGFLFKVFSQKCGLEIVS